MLGKGFDLFQCVRFRNFPEGIVEIPERIELVGFARFVVIKQLTPDTC